MSFPLSPTVGQTTVTNNITYIYNTGTNGVGYWTRQATTITSGSGGGGSGTAASGTGTTTTFIISNITSSTNTGTGALQVYGGVGVWGNVNIGGAVTGGGIRATSTSTVPTNPTTGDIWYNTTNDVILRYTFDGTSYYWIDMTTSVVTTGTSGVSQDVISPFLFIR
jgi:hypothetical protein